MLHHSQLHPGLGSHRSHKQYIRCVIDVFVVWLRLSVPSCLLSACIDGGKHDEYYYYYYSYAWYYKILILLSILLLLPMNITTPTLPMNTTTTTTTNVVCVDSGKHDPWQIQTCPGLARKILHNLLIILWIMPVFWQRTQWSASIF